ncbi:MAG: dihydroxyacetone kinase subunit DhaL [Actinomycetota bacterium]
MMDLESARSWMAYYGSGIELREDELNRLDAALGDGDFGASMQRGMTAVSEAMAPNEQGSIGELFKTVGMTLVSAMGGTSGPLVGTLFLRTGMTLGEVTEVGVEELAAALRAGSEGVMALGHATLGDKTMIDALLPAIDALEGSSTVSMAQAAGLAASAARDAAEATSELRARKGRASYVGDGGVGHIDPGAMGVSILFDALDQAVGRSS